MKPAIEMPHALYRGEIMSTVSQDAKTFHFTQEQSSERTNNGTNDLIQSKDTIESHTNM